MNDTLQRRFARLAGLTLAALLVCAIAAQMTAAYNVAGSGAGGGAVALSGPEPGAAATTSQAAATLQGRGGIASAAADGRASSTPTDSNVWTAILFSLAALLVGAVAWIAIDRRRGRLTGPALAAFCARNPADPLCGAT
ncbi:MAG TPA: hypothetical protein VFZ86_00505 [Thermoleophilia bacterium]|nr:hypothetical protein [Thermoleophilia bacterium]